MASSNNPVVSLVVSVAVIFLIVFTAGKAWKKA
jgi:hypothetical protein